MSMEMNIKTKIVSPVILQQQAVRMNTMLHPVVPKVPLQDTVLQDHPYHQELPSKGWDLKVEEVLIPLPLSLDLVLLQQV